MTCVWGTRESATEEFEAVALSHLDMLYRSALRLTHNRAEAEDLVQEAYLRAFRSSHRFTPGTNVRAWLFTILRNAFLNQRRQLGREAPEEDSVAWESATESVTLESGQDNPEEAFLQAELHGDVDRALKALPVVFREAVILTDLEGWTYKEASEALGCPIGTVMSRLSRGRSLLRQALHRYAQEHGYLRRSG